MSERVILLGLRVTSLMISVISVLGNVLICYIIACVKSLKTSMNYIIMNIAVLDSITGLFTIFYQVTFDYDSILGSSVLEKAHNNSAVLADVLCKMETFTYLGTTVSPFLLAAIAYERYKAIVHPLSRLSNEVTKARLKWILFLSWIWGLGYAIFDLYVIRYHPDAKYCDFKELSWYSYGVYEVVYSVIIYIIPSITIFVFYFHVIKTIRKEDGTLGSQVQRARAKTRIKVIRIIILVTLTFYICCVIPNTLYAIDLHFYNILRKIHIQEYFDDIYFIMLCFNSAFSPFVYLIFLKSFRKGLKDIFKACTTDGHTSLVNSHSQRSFNLEYIDVAKSGPENARIKTEIFELRLNIDKQ